MDSALELHVLNDGSIMKVISAKELIELEVWKGNRVIDLKHVVKIQTKIGSDFEKLKKLDNGYRIVSIEAKDAAGADILEYYVVDGQHRLKVLQEFYKTNLFADDFDIIVIEKRVKSETDIINYFNEINHAKPILWKSDPNMVVNLYIKALEKEFNKGKDKMIRESKTVRPYIFVADLRDQLLEVVSDLSTEKEEIDDFVRKAKEENEELLANAGIILAHCEKGQDKIIERATEHKFMLGIHKKFKWIEECLKSE